MLSRIGNWWARWTIIHSATCVAPQNTMVVWHSLSSWSIRSPHGTGNQFTSTIAQLSEMVSFWDMIFTFGPAAGGPLPEIHSRPKGATILPVTGARLNRRQVSVTKTPTLGEDWESDCMWLLILFHLVGCRRTMVGYAAIRRSFRVRQPLPDFPRAAWGGAVQ